LRDRNKLFAALRATGLDPSVATFEERKKVQKLVYLLQLFGVRLGFSYSWYLHGPYSPDLTKVLFDALANPKSIHVSEDVFKDDEKKIQKLKAFLGNRIGSTDFLELLVSLHYVKKAGDSQGASKQDILRFLKEKKPFFTEEEIAECWNRLQELEALAAY
jgi:uncharacterized protein YwgA